MCTCTCKTIVIFHFGRIILAKKVMQYSDTDCEEEEEVGKEISIFRDNRHYCNMKTTALVFPASIEAKTLEVAVVLVVFQSFSRTFM